MPKAASVIAVAGVGSFGGSRPRVLWAGAGQGDPFLFSLHEAVAEAALACAIICHAFQLASVLLLAGVALVAQGLSVRALTTLKEPT